MGHCQNSFWMPLDPPGWWAENDSQAGACDMTDPQKPFLSDVKTLRDRARKHLQDGAVTSTYVGDVKKTIELLQSVLATEIVCVLRYQMHAVAAQGISSDSVKAEFLEHAKEEQEHVMEVAERINQLGGKPNFNPE